MSNGSNRECPGETANPTTIERDIGGPFVVLSQQVANQDVIQDCMRATISTQGSIWSNLPPQRPTNSVCPLHPNLGEFTHFLQLSILKGNVLKQIQAT